MPKIELKVTHTHAGTVYPAGHVIEVDEHTARWLIDHRVGEPVTTSPVVQETAVGTATVPETQSQRKAKE